MPAKPEPGTTKNTALLLIDLITDFEFEDGDKLLKATIPVAKKVAALRKKAKIAGVPVIYVNDNWGKWQEDFKAIVRHFAKPSSKGSKVVSLIKPERRRLLHPQTEPLRVLFHVPHAAAPKAKR